MKMHERRAADLKAMATQFNDHRKLLTDSANLLIDLSRDNARLRSIMLANGLIAGPMTPKKRNAVWKRMVEHTSQLTGVSIDDLMGKSQRHSIGNPRRIMITAWREVTNDSLANIGRRFGRKHHAVMHSIRVTKAECTVYEDVRVLKDAIADFVRAQLDKYHKREREARILAQ